MLQGLLLLVSLISLWTAQMLRFNGEVLLLFADSWLSLSCERTHPA